MLLEMILPSGNFGGAEGGIEREEPQGPLVVRRVGQ